MIETINLLSISFCFIEYTFFNYIYNLQKYNNLIIKLHIFSQMVFFIVVYISSFFELISYLVNQYNQYMLIVPYIDNYIAGTSLNITCLTGILYSKIKYGKKIPNHIQKVINYLIYFGLFWLLTDKTSQLCKSSFIFYVRFIVNIISCIFVLKIKNLMLKKIRYN